MWPDYTSVNPHFDKQIFDRMQQIGFSLKPKSEADQEMSSEPTE